MLAFAARATTGGREAPPIGKNIAATVASRRNNI